MDISEKELQRRTKQRHQSLELNERERLSYTIPQLVMNTGVGRSTLYGEISAGRLRIKKVGKRSIILRGDALAWLEALPAA